MIIWCDTEHRHARGGCIDTHHAISLKPQDWQSDTERALQEVGHVPGRLPMQETQRLLSQALSACEKLAGTAATAALTERALRTELDQLRQERGTAARQAYRLIAYAFHLCQNGERAPGGDESWAEFARRAEQFLRAGASPCPARELGALHPAVRSVTVSKFAAAG